MSVLISEKKKVEILALIDGYIKNECDSTVSIFAQKTGLSLSTAQRLARASNFPSHKNLTILKKVIPEIENIQKRVDPPSEKMLSSKKTQPGGISMGEMQLAKELIQQNRETLQMIREVTEGALASAVDRLKALEQNTNDRLKAMEDRITNVVQSINLVEQGSQQRHEKVATSTETLENRLTYLTKKIIDGDLGRSD